MGVNYLGWEFINEYLLNEIKINKNIKIVIDNIPSNILEIKKKGDILIFLQIESSFIIDQHIMKLLSNDEIYQQFDLILTWDERLLKRPKTIKFMSLFKYSWVKFPPIAGINPYIKHHYNNIQPLEYNNKKFFISTLCGDKNWCPGHKMRHAICSKQKEITIPKRFYKPKKTEILKIFDDNIDISETRDKSEMFDCMFHIAVENNRGKDYFTEKLIDCIVSKTVPIYYGCPNIGDYFDLNGIIIVNDENDCIAKINKLNKKTYKKMKPYVEKNFKTWLVNMPSFEEQLDKVLQIL